MPLVKKPLAERPPGIADDAFAASLAGLQSAKAEARWTAARKLAHAMAVPVAVPALAKQLAIEPDQHVREAILSSLAKIDNSESFEAVLAYLRADDASLRTAALDALKLMPATIATKLDDLLQDPDVDIRILSCDLARAVPVEISQTALLQVVRAEQNINVCAAAIDLLADIGSAEILPELAACATRLQAAFLDFAIGMATKRIAARSAQPSE